MTTFVNYTRAPPNPYYRTSSYAPQQQQPVRPAADVRDDYERWYTESVPSNRMSLSLRSGILSEVAWALDRLCRLCHNEQFLLNAIPGLIDGLFDWPEWYLAESYKMSNAIFSPPPDCARKRRYALESLFILRNASLLEANAFELSNHSHMFPLIMKALLTLQFDRDEDSEFLLHVIDLYQVFAAKLVVSPATPVNANPFPLLQKIAGQSSNRTMIIAALTALTNTLSNLSNASNLASDAPALGAAIRYLPLFIDKPLVEACLNYLYVHISHMNMARAFLLRPEMPGVLKVLVTLLLQEQKVLEEKVTLDLTGSVHAVPILTTPTRDHELTREEMDDLLPKLEPQRCYDWMKAMFVAKADGELTQVDFWNLYKDAFTPYQEQYPLLVASDVIKNVNFVFPQAQAMVLSGPMPKFIVRGVDRRKDSITNERFKCRWDRSQCSHTVFSSPGDLYEHLLTHISETESAEIQCLWSTCLKTMPSVLALRSHALTHLPSSQTLPLPPSQSDTITLPSQDAPYPTESPTDRPPPPLRSIAITYERPVVDPPSGALTALLVIRILFRTSFASADEAPRADADHFGFPGIVEEQDEQEVEMHSGDYDSEKEGERRGRRAFAGVRRLLEGVKIRDEVLNGWIHDMVNVGIPGANQ